jgi:type IV secretion system protein VirD4
MDNTLRDYLGASGEQNGNGSSNGSKSRPILDYLSAMEGRNPRPGINPSTRLMRMDRTIPDGYFMASRHHPIELFRRIRTNLDDRQPASVPLGMVGGTWTVTYPDRHVLAIAPPRSSAGKTSGLIVPAVLSHPNPVVTASTKIDVMTATAMPRAQYGEPRCYAPAGGTDTIPAGVKELRWSPISGARDWDLAVATATAMTAMLDTDTMRGGKHWTDRAADLLAAVFHWAALSGATMRDARDAVFGATGRLQEIALDLDGYGAQDAAKLLHSVISASTEEYHSIASSASRALKGYRTNEALRSTENPNFDIADFVNGGHPYSVRADTVYIAARSDEQELVAPLVVGLLTQIQREVYRRHRGLAAAGLENKAGAAPVLFALDELFGLAPLPNLPAMLSEGGSQGLLIVAAIQDLTLIKSRWREADGFLTMFGHVLVYPGVRDVTTLRSVSELLGKYEHEKRQIGVKRSAAEPVPFMGPYDGPYEDKEESAQISSELRPIYDINQVMLGPDPTNHDELFHFGPLAVGTVTATPYYRSAPWPMLLTSYLERALSGRVPEWRLWESTLSHEQPECEDTLPVLPVPRLDEWANKAMADRRTHPCDRAWASRYLAAVRARDELLRRGPRSARWDLGRPVDRSEMWAVTHPAGRIPRQLSQGVVTTERDAPRSQNPVAHTPVVTTEPAPSTAATPAVGRDAADSLRVYVTRGGDQITVTDAEIALLASGEMTPGAGILAELWAPHQEFADNEARGWRRATDAAQKPERERSDEENTQIAWAVQRRHVFQAGTFAWLHNLVHTEKIRRRLTGDTASVTRYEAAVAKAWNDGLTEGTPAYEEQREKERTRAEARDRGEPSPQWTFMPSRQRSVIEAFILRRDLEQDGKAGDDPTGQLARLEHALDEFKTEAAAYRPAPLSQPPTATAQSSPATSADPIPAVTAAPSAGPALAARAAPSAESPVPPPERWEPDWGPGEDRAISRWAGTGAPLPDCVRSNLTQMMAAVYREKERRRRIGDAVSAALYEGQARRLRADAAEKRSDGSGPEEIIKAKFRGFWAFLSPGMEELNKAFLNGDDLNALYGEGPIPPPLSNKPDGMTDERWRRIQEDTERERAGRVTRWRKSA